MTCLVNLDTLFLFIETIYTLYDDFGYFGILLISFLASVIIFIPVPYFPFIVTAAFNKSLDPHLIALSSAVGATIAKMIIFYASYYGRKILSSETKKRMAPLQKIISKFGWAAAFVAAITPIPDDMIYIPLGLTKYHPVKFITATFAGKFMLSEIIVWGSVFLGRPFVERYLADTEDQTYLLIITIISIAILVAIIFFSLRIDWSKLIGKWFPWTMDDKSKDRAN